MALWGNLDNITGAPTSVNVVGTASSEFWTAQAGGLSGIATGTTILLGTEPGEDGFLVIESFLATDYARCGKMSGVGTVVDQAFPAAYSTQPISLKNDPAFAESAANIVTGISTVRTQVLAGVATAGVEAANAAGVGGIHAGWVGIMTYVDMHGNLRTKSETYVAMSGISTGNRPYPAA